MADGTTVLREYLVSLGFKVDQTQGKKFEDGLQRWDKRANALGKALGGVAVAATAAVSTFAYSMERLYFASKRTDSAVGSIQALEYGAKRVGVSGNAIRDSLESMARNIRANPGLTGLLNSLGIQVTGRDKADVLTDLVGQLNKMPFYVAQRYASLFGIDPDQLFMLQQGLEEFKKAQAARKQMAADMGVDGDKAAAAAHELVNEWREVAERVGIFKDAVLQEALPALLQLSGVVKELTKDWTRLVQEGNLGQRIMEGLGLQAPGGRASGVVLSKESQDRLGVPMADRDPNEGGTHRKRWLDKKWDQFRAWGRGMGKGPGDPTGDQASVDAAQDTEAFRRGGRGPLSYVPNGRGGYTYQPQLPGAPTGSPEGPAGASPGAAQAPAGASPDMARAQELFKRLEQQYGLPEGTLDRTWKTESGRGQNLTGPETRKWGRAKGHFQFIDATAQEYGLDKDGGRADRDDLAKSAEAAARMWRDLLKRFNGDARKAAAAYNWGPDNVARQGLGAAPRETRDYMDRVAGPARAPVEMNQTNHVTVTGVSDPAKAAALTREQIDQSNAEVVRNLNPARIN